MATLDLCRIDLYRGECETVKAGGAAGFIKRSDRVEKIQSRQLPLGMSASEDISEKKWQLNSGDLVILVSDGVVQNWPCGDGEYLLEQKIASFERQLTGRPGKPDFALAILPVRRQNPGLI